MTGDRAWTRLQNRREQGITLLGVTPARAKHAARHQPLAATHSEGHPGGVVAGIECLAAAEDAVLDG